MAEIIYFFACAVVVFVCGTIVFACMYKQENDDDNDR